MSGIKKISGFVGSRAGETQLGKSKRARRRSRRKRGGAGWRGTWLITSGACAGAWPSGPRPVGGGGRRRGSEGIYKSTRLRWGTKRHKRARCARNGISHLGRTQDRPRPTCAHIVHSSLRPTAHFFLLFGAARCLCEPSAALAACSRARARSRSRSLVRVTVRTRAGAGAGARARARVRVRVEG